jgi:hypothetical protein
MPKSLKLLWTRKRSGALSLKIGAASAIYSRQHNSGKWRVSVSTSKVNFDHDRMRREMFKPIEEMLNGAAILHGALISKGRDGFLLLADSETGKSTLTAYLVNHGWRAHTDDMTKIRFMKNRVLGSGVRQSISLDRRSSVLLGLQQIPARGAKISLSLRGQTKVVAIKSVFFLSRSKRWRTRVAAPMEAMIYLLKGSWRPPLHLDSQFGLYAAQIAKMVEKLPCEVVEYPRQKSSLLRFRKHLERRLK